MARDISLTSLTNPLISSKQLIEFRNATNQQAADALLHRVSQLIQTAGILLRLPQEVIATAIILLQRYLIIISRSQPDLLAAEGAQYTTISPLITTSSAALFLAAKQSFYALTPRSIINVYAVLTSPTASPLKFINSVADYTEEPPDPSTYFVSEGTYEIRRDQLFAAEKHILINLGFDTKVVLPYTLALTYLQALQAKDSELAGRVLAHLTTALLSPQLLYLTHQPNQLAVSAIYLAARECGVALVDEGVPWWEVFDVSREELGFLVLSLSSIEGFVKSLEDG